MHRIILARETIEELVTLIRHVPIEMCGFVMDDETVKVMKNWSPDPVHYFEMMPDEVMDLYDQIAKNGGARPVAVWHSHPSGRTRASERDLKMAVPNMPNLLVAGDRVLAFANCELLVAS